MIEVRNLTKRFGTITALYGLNAGIIDRTQFSLLIAAVVLSAIVPTVIAQRFFQPAGREPDWEEVGAPSPALEGVSD